MRRKAKPYVYIMIAGRVERRARARISRCRVCRAPVKASGKLGDVGIRCSFCMDVFCFRCSWLHFGFRAGPGGPGRLPRAPEWVRYWLAAPRRPSAERRRLVRKIGRILRKKQGPRAPSRTRGNAPGPTRLHEQRGGGCRRRN